MKTELTTGEAMKRLGSERKIPLTTSQEHPVAGIAGAWLPVERVWIRSIVAKLRESGSSGTTTIRLKVNGVDIGGELKIESSEPANAFGFSIPSGIVLCGPENHDDISVDVVEVAEGAQMLIIQVNCVEVFE